MCFKYAVIAIILAYAFTSNALSQWVQSTGTSGGPVNCFAVSGTNLFAGTENGGVFISSDDGLNWAPVNSGLTDTTIYSLATSGTNLFVGTWTRGVFISADNGISWKSRGLPGGAIEALAANNTNIFAGTQTGIFRSTDVGITWDTINTGLSSTYVYSLLISDTNVFAGTDKGVFRLDHSETNWTLVLPNITHALSESGDKLFAATYGRGVFLSTNNGSTWNAIDSGMKNQYGQTLAINGRNLFEGSWGGGILLSSKNDIFWKDENLGLTNTFVLSSAMSKTTMFVGCRGGDIWRRPLSDFGISDVTGSPKSDINVTVSPNPTTGIIRVQNASANILHIFVTNILGQKVIEYDHPNAPEFTIDLSKLVSGTYLARFTLGKEAITREIIKE